MSIHQISRQKVLTWLQVCWISQFCGVCHPKINLNKYSRKRGLLQKQSHLLLSIDQIEYLDRTKLIPYYKTLVNITIWRKKWGDLWVLLAHEYCAEHHEQNFMKTQHGSLSYGDNKIIWFNDVNPSNQVTTCLDRTSSLDYYRIDSV